MTSDIIRAAIEQLRASVEALPEGFRVPWALSRENDYVVPSHDAEDERSYYVVAHAPVCAPHIALAASPDVTEALIKHLRTIAEHDNAADGEHWEDCLDAISTSAVALAVAITHRSPE